MSPGICIINSFFLFLSLSLYGAPIRIGTTFDYESSFALEYYNQLENSAQCEKFMLADFRVDSIDFEPVSYTDKNQMLLDLKSGKIDAAIGDFALNPYLIQDFLYSTPYHRTNVVLLGHQQEKNNLLFIFLKSIFTLNLLKVLVIFFMITLFFAHMIWVFDFQQSEKKDTWQQSYRSFFLESFWVAFNTNGKLNLGSILPPKGSWVNKIFSILIWLFTLGCTSLIIYNINIELQKNRQYNVVNSLKKLEKNHSLLVFQYNEDLVRKAKDSTKASLNILESIQGMSKAFDENPNAYVLIKENNLSYFQKLLSLKTKTIVCAQLEKQEQIAILYHPDFYLKNYDKITKINQIIEYHREMGNFEIFYQK
ncbi:MAG: hypothetical protein MUE53_08740 [Chitinophagales bacterium]|jgi:hypothetical protein|nr:hypothetical protein [Chitinophagales bacterium]